MTRLESTCPSPLIQISGYSLTEQIYAGSQVIVYRAIETASQRSVVIKFPQQDYPSFNDLLQFRNQYTIAKNLTISGIVHPYSLEPWGNSYALVMEDVGGISLRQWLDTLPNSPSSHAPNALAYLIDCLAIALQLAVILHDLHQNHVIHKDIKPANILIHPETKQVNLIDFSIASLLPKETQEIKNPHELEGTLAYLAPEQTGRMNRGIDYRADFYALGVTLFELLTGQLPFQADDPMELVHCHLAKSPPSIHELNSEVPGVLADIVGKLMAKNAEDRYQSALGLQHDLQVCLNQLRETGTIAPFEIGTRDVCDRFLIPEKLYGREADVQMLLDAFDRVADGASELMLVAGFSGIGKTSVVNEVQKPITRQKGYFIKGKFDQFNRNIPFSTFVQAFRDLMGQLLSESDTQLQTWKAIILKTLGDNAQVIIDVIPELERIVGQQPPAPELSGTAAQNRFNLLLQAFIRVFTQPTHPLVIFLDDLQWADSASLTLMQLLMQDSAAGYLLVIGAYRDNEVFAAHPVMLTLATLRKIGSTVNTITLQPLSLESLNHLVADTLRCTSTLAEPLTNLIAQKTQGNPFFATQFLKALHQDHLITFDPQVGSWQVDVARVHAAALTDEVVALMAERLQKLPEPTQVVLQLAACIGNQFDLQTLAIISEQTEVDTADTLWTALQEGLILPQNDVYKFFSNGLEPDDRADMSSAASVMPSVAYRFLHDRVQQAAYALIPDTHKATIHYRIGRLLLSHFSSAVQDERVFELAGHLNPGSGKITDPDERIELARLNLAAGRKARASTAYGAAVDYFTTGIFLLPNDAWKHHYHLTLALHTEVSEAAYLNTDFQQMEQWAASVLQHAQTLLDTIPVQQTRLARAKSQGQILDALQMGLQILTSLGVDFPDKPTQADVGQAFGSTRRLWQDNAPLSLFDLPAMTDPTHLAAMQILSWLVPCAYWGSPTLMALIIFKQVELSIQHGNCPVSIYGYADYGLILCGVIGDISSGYDFGQLALKLLDQLQATPFKARAWYIVHTYIQHWKKPLQDSIPQLQKAYQSGLETGDLEAASLNAAAYCSYAYHAGQELTGLVNEIQAYRQTICQLQQTTPQHYLEIYQQTVLNLLGRSEIPYQLMGEVFNETASRSLLQAANHRTALFYLHFNQTVLSYLFGQYQQAAQQSILAEQYLDGGIGTFMVSLYAFYDSLVQLALYSSASEEEQRQILERVEMHQSKLQGWATLAPSNHQHCWELVEAERYAVCGDRMAAIEHYDRAIAGAHNNLIQEESLAHELAAKFYLDWGKEKIAAVYMQDAYYGYAHWGAKAKTDDLKARYPNLLRPILQQATQPLTMLETLATITAPKHSNPTTPGPSQSSSTSINTALDFAAILKASQSLSSTIQLDELLRQLTQIILQNSGGDRCALILPSGDGTWQVAAIATPETTDLCSEPLHGNPNVPVKLIQYVKNTQDLVVIDDLKTDLPVIGHYLTQWQPKSILCLPILNQGQLIGILYLGNQSTSGVFTGDRILILTFLCTQAAISLENARLYQQSQTYAHQLEQSLEQLQTSETRFQKLADNVPGLIYQIRIKADGSASIPYVSSGCQTLYEVAAEDLMTGKYSLRDFEHPDDQAAISQAMVESAQNLTPFRHEWRIVTPNGDIKWVRAASQPERRDDGEMVWDGMVIDISDRKSIEQLQQVQSITTQLLADAESLTTVMPQLLQALCVTLDWSLGELWLLDSATQTLKLSQTWHVPSADLAEFSALSQSSQFASGIGLPGRVWAAAASLWIMDVCQDRQFLRSAISNQFNLHTAVGFPILTHHGIQGVLTLFTHHTRPIDHSFIEALTIIGSQIGQFIDRKTTEAASKAFQERLTFLIQQTPIGMIEWNTEFKVISWNPAAEKIFGYRADEMLNHHAVQIVPESDQAHVAKVMTALIEQHGGFYSLNQNIRSDGTIITCEWINTPLRNAEGNAVGIFSMVQDVSDRIAADAAIQQKSRELEQALQELQNAQLQMVQSEKMASLGNMMAGIAHEINNPIGFLNGSIGNAKDYVQDLLGHLALYQQHHPEAAAPITQNANDIDLGFLSEDLPKLLESMKGAIDRIKSISTSLRTFSRADTEYKVSANLHEGIDGALLILKYRLKANEHRPEINVVKEYGDLLAINCFPGQLNQVFMNILANAIDMFDEVVQTRSFAELEAKPQQITIHTVMVENQAQISIQDNGKGMTAEVKARVFDHLFTTKSVGKGTGLGLAIARQIVVEKHGGSIDVQSEQGEGSEFIIQLPIA